MVKTGLTKKQQLFVDAYDGNATEAARIAGYKIPRIAGWENMNKPAIKKAIAGRGKKESIKTIASRQERQEFWTAVMLGVEKDNGKKPTLKDRLRASELLGKSEADFTENQNVDLKGSLSVAEAIIKADKEKS